MRNLLGIVVFFIGFITGCGGRTINDSPTHSTETNGLCTAIAHPFTSSENAIKNVAVSIDETFSFEHQGMIINAFNTWRSDSNYLLDYKISCVGDMSRAQKLDGNVLIINRDPGLAIGIAGETYWTPERIQAIVLVSDVLTDDFERVVMHELGHVFNLPHDSSQFTSIMKPAEGDTTVPQCQDIQAFCAIWGCSVSCTPTLLSASAPIEFLSIRNLAQ